MDAFYVRLDSDGTATVWMKEHHATEESARHVVEQYLRWWEISAALEYGRRPVVRFEFVRADVLDLDPPPPPPPGAPHVILRGTAIATAQASGIMLVSHEPRYPNPPDEFRVSAEVDVLWTLYTQYREGRYPLLPMTYAFLTFLEAHAGGQREAARRYRVSKNVLKKLSRLSTNLGTEVGARKHHANSELRAPTNQEVRWIESALRVLIRRVGQVTYDDQQQWPARILGAEWPLAMRFDL